MNALVPIQTSNAEVYRSSTDAAGLCKDIVVASALTIQDRKYVRVEGWQAIAIAHGCTGSARDVEAVPGGVRAIGEVRRMSDGAVIAEAEGFVGEDEAVWFGGDVESDVWEGPRGNRRKTGRKEIKTLPKRPDYAIRAMAQTRAISRACRSAFAHVVVMMNAGLSTTPAEEVPADGFGNEPRNITPEVEPKTEPPKTEARTSEPKASVSWQTLDDEMDLCRSVAELEAWNERRKAEIKALPEAKYNVLADKFGDLRSKLPDVTPAPSEQAEKADAYAIADDEIPY